MEAYLASRFSWIVSHATHSICLWLACITIIRADPAYPSQAVRCGQSSEVGREVYFPAGDGVDRHPDDYCQPDEKVPCRASSYDQQCVTQNHHRRKAEVAVAGEFLLDTNVVYFGALGDQDAPSNAFDGTNYLSVWADRRTGAGWDIYGARVGPDGRCIDPVGIAISAAIWDQQEPAVAFDGTNYLVVWHDMRLGSRDIYGARVTPSGTVLDPSGLAICTDTSDQGYPAVAFDGTNYLVVWQDLRNGITSDIYGARVTPSGQVLEPSGVTISSNSDNQCGPAVAFGGSCHLVAWEDRRNGSSYDIYSARVDRSGAVLDSAGLVVSNAPNDQIAVSVTSNGSSFLVGWRDLRAVADGDIYGARVASNGVVLDPAGILVSGASGRQSHPSVSSDGSGYLVAWEDHRTSINAPDVYGARVSQAGVVLDPSGIALADLADTQRCPAVAFGGSSYLVTWADNRSGPPQYLDIYGGRVTPSGGLPDSSGRPLSTVTYMHDGDAAAFDGTNYLVVWPDRRSGKSYDMYAARVSQTGTILDPTGIIVISRADLQIAPDVVFDGTNYFAVWRDSVNPSRIDIVGTRITTAGIVIDTQGMIVSNRGSIFAHPDVAFDGTNYLLTWESDSQAILGRRVSRSGVIIDTMAITISSGTGEKWRPASCFDGSNYFIVWEDERGGPPDIYGARVSPAGVVMDTAGLPIVKHISVQWRPAVAVGTSNYLVVWQEGRNGGNWDIYGSRVTKSGIVLDTAGIAITVAPAYQEHPTVVYDGQNFLVAWTDRRYGYAAIGGAMVDEGGTVIDSFRLTNMPGRQVIPRLAVGPGGQVLVTFGCFTDSINGRPVSVFRTWGKFFTPSEIRETPVALVTTRGGLRVFPNPFRRRCVISGLPLESGRIVLRIYDARGNLIRSLAAARVETSVQWNGRDNNGHPVPSGVYFCVLRSHDRIAVRKIVREH